MIMRILDEVKETFVDGTGIRYSIYVSGCERCCSECHNPQSWDFENGYELTDSVMERIKSDYAANPLLNGFTILGGEPFHPRNRDGLVTLITGLRSTTTDIWIYTGYTLEELLAEEDARVIFALSRTSILVDGPYKKELKTSDEPFIGSSNQRLIRTHDMALDSRLKAVYVDVYTVK